MEADPLRLLTASCGFFTRTEAREAGYADRDVTRMVRHRLWIRIRRGAYVFTDEWTALDAVARHRVRAGAVMRSLGDAVALSHVSAACVHGIDLWGHDLSRIHVTRLDGGAGRLEGDVVHHEGFCLDDDVMRVAGMLVLRPQRCVLEAASRGRDEAALCLLDSGLRSETFDAEALAATYEILRCWPFMHRLAPLVPLADGRSGSVGESRGRWLFYVGKVPMPDLQVPIHRRDGTVAGSCDWGWQGRRLLGEFDGRIKYGRLLKPGQQPGDAVFEEKRREDEIRELSGCAMLRLIWDDYAIQQVTLARVRRALRLAS
jgi:hypothetical protein